MHSAENSTTPHQPTCPICKSPPDATGQTWRFTCEICDIEFSTLMPDISDSNSSSPIDENLRHDALDQLRRENCNRILRRLDRVKPLKNQTLLDIGCAYGWFIEGASLHEIQCIGIEPESGIAKEAIKRGNNVVTGFFPEDIPRDASFDIITFNDVLEHIPMPARIITACYEHLKPAGLLSITLPIKSGPLYRISKILALIGVQKPLERMWQKSFQSPDISYFSARSLQKAANQAGFTLVYSGDLPSISLSGLWARLRYDRSASIAGSLVQWVGLISIGPVLRILRSDIMHFVFQKR